MKYKYLILLLLLPILAGAYTSLTVDNANAGVQQVVNSDSSILTIDNGNPPFLESALFWLDGTIVGDAFVDKTGNGRNFTITNKDFTSDYFPFKSEATISAPVGDTELIAADVDNFLYSSGGTPINNEVTAFFQNIHYANKLFTKHLKRSTNSVGIELTEPSVSDIVLYETEITGTYLDVCNVYYDVPEEAITNVLWAKVSGTGDGSKANPYSMVNALANALDGDTIYVKTGFHYNPSGSFTIDKGLTIIGTGSVRLVTAVSPAVQITATTDELEFNFSHIKFEAQNQWWGLEDTVNMGDCDINIDKCFFYGHRKGAVHIQALASNMAISDCSIVAPVTLEDVTARTVSCDNFGVEVEMIGNYIHDRSFYGVTCNLPKFHYNKIVQDGAIGKDWERSVNPMEGTDVSIKYNSIISTSLCVTVKSMIYVYGAKSVEIAYNYFSNVENIYSYEDILVIGSDDEQLTNSCWIHNNYSENVTISSHVYTVGTEETSLGDNKISGIIIENNTILGGKYFDPATTLSTHNIFVGFQKNGVIRNNYVNGGGMSIIYKGSSGTDNVSGYISNNLIINPSHHGIYVKGVSNLPVYSNTIYNELEGTLDKMLYFSSNLVDDICENNIVKNNILVNLSSYVGTLTYISKSVNMDIDNNIMFSKNGYYGGTFDDVGQTFAQWNALDYDTNSIELVEAQVDSLFTSIITNDFSLKTGSKAIDIGATLDPAYDHGLDSSTDWIDGNNLPTIINKDQTAPWDIGAYVN